LISKLDKPLFYVRGNHAHPMEYSDELGGRSEPHGAVDLHRRVKNHKGLLLAGVQGSLRYRPGPYQYSQAEMFAFVLGMCPSLLLNRMQYGRALDIFVTHAPPQGIHDASDLPHRGIWAFRWLIQVFKPAYHLHGHIHVYRADTVMETQVGSTRVVNTYGYRVTNFDLPPR
jgi:Icc-related predicted phosphoesterase